MSSLTGLDDVVNRLTGGNSGTPETIWFYKAPRLGAGTPVATVQGALTSLWQYNGQPSDGAAPTTVANPTNATAGALKQTDAGGGRQKYLLGVNVTSNSAGTLILYDRLLHIGGLSGAVATAQTVSGTLTRNTGGVGNQIWAEVYTAIGASGATISASYTNESATSGQTSGPAFMGGSPFEEAQRILPIPVGIGDIGVQAVANVTLTGSTGTAGNFGINIVQPLLYIPVLAGVGANRDLIMNGPGILPISAGACLAWAWMANTTTIPEIVGYAQFIEA